MAKIETLEALRALYPSPGHRAVAKELDHLDPHCRHFISLSPFLLLASAASDGPADVSPRGESPGFVAVEDEKTLLLPDRPGNNRLDSLTNILSNPEVALIFLIPGVRETLRVNGTAEIRDDAELLERFRERDKLPRVVLRITVRQAFLQCAKAVLRSGLWDPEAQVDRSVLPTIGEMLRDQIGGEGEVESEEAMLERYLAGLY
jgi:hypothetical protein